MERIESERLEQWLYDNNTKSAKNCELCLKSRWILVKMYNRRKIESRPVMGRVQTDGTEQGGDNAAAAAAFKHGRDFWATCKRCAGLDPSLVSAQWCSWVLLTDRNIKLWIKLFQMIKDRSSSNKQTNKKSYLIKKHYSNQETDAIILNSELLQWRHEETWYRPL